MTWVQDGIFAGGGPALPAGWEDFARQTGITAILHLSPGRPNQFLGPTPAAFLWLPVDQEDLADDALRRLAGEFIAACLAAGRRVLLHAASGRHRTRWPFVAFRICTGSSPATALRRAAEPPWMAPYRTDPERWERFAAGLHGTELAAAQPTGD
jgi:hypothetical protein